MNEIIFSTARALIGYLEVTFLSFSFRQFDSLAVFIFIRPLGDLLRENRGSVNRLCL